jgi:hypothetical protein
MTVNIDIQVTGDHWLNRPEFIEKLENTDPSETIILDMHSEAPSLERLGIREIVDAWLVKNNRLPETIFIKQWTNVAEQTPYKKLDCINVSHFFKYSQNYWSNNIILGNRDSRLFGLFLGRRTIARNSILYFVANHWSNYFLLSVMQNKNFMHWPPNNKDTVNLEILDEWIATDNQDRVFDWIATCNIPSIDDRSVQDQYTVVEQSAAECNQSLLAHYHRFHIELVCESYTIGDTFFPTEKTVRPMSAGKPMLVYGPKNFLARLRSLGFQTYFDCWSEEYDQLEGPARWQAIQRVIKDLIDLSDSQLNTVLEQAQLISTFNRQHLQKLIKKC